MSAQLGIFGAPVDADAQTVEELRAKLRKAEHRVRRLESLIKNKDALQEVERQAEQIEKLLGQGEDLRKQVSNLHAETSRLRLQSSPSSEEHTLRLAAEKNARAQAKRIEELEAQLERVSSSDTPDAVALGVQVWEFAARQIEELEADGDRFYEEWRDAEDANRELRDKVNSQQRQLKAFEEDLAQARRTQDRATEQANGAAGWAGECERLRKEGRLKDDRIQELRAKLQETERNGAEPPPQKSEAQVTQDLRARLLVKCRELSRLKARGAGDGLDDERAEQTRAHLEAAETLHQEGLAREQALRTEIQEIKTKYHETLAHLEEAGAKNRQLKRELEAATKTTPESLMAAYASQAEDGRSPLVPILRLSFRGYEALWEIIHRDDVEAYVGGNPPSGPGTYGCIMVSEDALDALHEAWREAREALPARVASAVTDRLVEADLTRRRILARSGASMRDRTLAEVW